MITISIVSHSQAALVANLLDDLARIASPLVDAIVITRNVAEEFHAFPSALAHKIEIVENRTRLGFGVNHNAAFSRCKSPVFAILNPDLRLPHDPFARMIEALDDSTANDDAADGAVDDAADGAVDDAVDGAVDNAACGLVAPMIVSTEGVREDSARALPTPFELFARRALGRRDRAPRPDWLAGMFLFVRSDAFASVGGFDPRYFMYCEDFDLCARLRLRGWRFRVVEDAIVVHAAQRASHRSLRHLAWHLASLVKMWSSAAFWRYRRLLIAERG